MYECFNIQDKQKDNRGESSSSAQLRLSPYALRPFSPSIPGDLPLGNFSLAQQPRLYYQSFPGQDIHFQNMSLHTFLHHHCSTIYYITIMVSPCISNITFTWNAANTIRDCSFRFVISLLPSKIINFMICICISSHTHTNTLLTI